MVLESHKRIGKRFVPPFLQLGPIQEAPWVDRLLPELLWIGMLNDRYGIARGAAICAELAKLGQEVLESGERRAFLCRISSFGLFTGEEQGGLVQALKVKGMYRELGETLAPFCAAYPKCPLSFLVENPGDLKEGTAYIRKLLPKLLDRWGESATFVQVHAVYMAIVQGRLFVQRGMAMANFPAVEAYPHTEEARKIASACRATVNMFFGPIDSDPDDSWAGYFWNRGLELEPCEPMRRRETGRGS